jgi:hypothetical protein
MAYDPTLLVFKEKAHKYYYDGVHVPGVTTVLGNISKGDGILQWAVNLTAESIKEQMVGEISTEDVVRICDEAKKAHRLYKEEAGDIGHIAHDWIEQHLHGNTGPLPDHPKARNACEAALRWLDIVKWETVEAEKPIFHAEYGYAGTLDWKARINGVLCIADWKTSKSMYSSFRYQTAAYLRAEEAQTGEHIPDRWICRIDKNGEFDPDNDVLYMAPESIEADFNVFLAALTIHRREAELRRFNA